MFQLQQELDTSGGRQRYQYWISRTVHYNRHGSWHDYPIILCPEYHKIIYRRVWATTNLMVVAIAIGSFNFRRYFSPPQISSRHADIKWYVYMQYND